MATKDWETTTNQAIAAPYRIRPILGITPKNTSLYDNGVPIARGLDVGPWVVTPFMIKSGSKYDKGPLASPAIENRDWKVSIVSGTLKVGETKIPMSLNLNGILTPFVLDTTNLSQNVFRAGNCDIHALLYPSAIRLDVRMRVKKGQQISHAAISLPTDKIGTQLNLEPGGLWDGDFMILPGIYATVENAVEKFPRGYKADGKTCELILHTNKLTQDTSKEGMDNLMAYHTGVLTSTMCPQYMDYITNDPLYKQVAKEIPAASQQEPGDFYVTMRFWISLDGFVNYHYLAPVVRLDGFKSQPFSMPDPGLCDEDIKVVDKRMLNLWITWVDQGPRGSLLFGDAPEDPYIYYRRRGLPRHYFATTVAWFYSLWRDDVGYWYNIAKAMNQHERDVWVDGFCSLYKRLTPWGSTYTTNGHWANSEALLFGWLIDLDYHSLAEYKKWMSVVTCPTSLDREGTVAKRMFDVAYWYTNDTKWKTWADSIETRVRANIEAIKQTPDYQKYGIGLPEGILFHPLWTDKPLGLPPFVEGALNVVDLAFTGQLDKFASQILYGDKTWVRKENMKEVWKGPGLCGERYIGLQRTKIMEYFRAKRIQAKERQYYGVSKDGHVRVVVDKSTAASEFFTICLGQRVDGDIPPVIIDITDPTGKKTSYDFRVDPTLKFPVYPIETKYRDYRDGWPLISRNFFFPNNIPGRYIVDIWGHEFIELHGPLSDHPEWQDYTASEWQWPGHPKEGSAYPILLGNP